ncbi:MAG: hypothetical protein ABIJ47_06130 [Candidatus Bathyarchaeota archaeon]
METLPKRTRQMLLAANVFMVIVVVADLFYLTNMIQVDLPSFTLLNLLVLGLGLWSFKVKRDLKARLLQGKGGDGDSGGEDAKDEVNM